MPLSSDHGHQQLKDWAADQLRSAISEGRLQPGEWLRQERLARELGVSHMPVREALKQLAAEGIVEYLPYRGMRVVEFTPEDIEDIYAVRAALEGRAARAAAQRLSPRQIDELRTLLAAMAESMAPELLALNRSQNRRFHELIYRASERAYLIRALDQMWSWFPTMFLDTYPVTAHAPVAGRDTDGEEHEAVLAALIAGDGLLAEQLLAQHVMRAGLQLVAVLRAETHKEQPES
jgi:DNA-binding GntR family transcriptional regulator